MLKVLLIKSISPSKLKVRKFLASWRKGWSRLKRNPPQNPASSAQLRALVVFVLSYVHRQLSFPAVSPPILSIPTPLNTKHRLSGSDDLELWCSDDRVESSWGGLVILQATTPPNIAISGPQPEPLLLTNTTRSVGPSGLTHSHLCALIVFLFLSGVKTWRICFKQ